MVAASALAVPPTINVTWEESPPPQPDDDYIITTTDPDFPDVELKAASETWRIWSEDADNPGGIGDIGVISSPHPENFGVKIEDDLGGDGARDVKGINLDPTNAANYSNLTGANITGTLSGFTFLQRSSGGGGGDVTGTVTIDTISGAMLIAGDVLAPMTVATVSSAGGVAIFGNLGTPGQNADINITTALAGGFSIKGTATNYGDITVQCLSAGLLVSGTVPSGNTVTIQDVTIAASLTVGTLAGRLELMNGIPSECPVPGGGCPPGSDYAKVVVSVLKGTGVIDLNGADVAGILSVTQAKNNSQIIAGGDVSGFIYPGFTPSGFFNGTLTVLSVSAISTLGDPTIPAGEIEAFSGAALNGTVNVTGVNAGLVEASGAFTGQINVGSVADSGVIETAQAALGNIVVSGACAGAIEIEGALSGTVEIAGALTSTGSVTVGGDATGNIEIDGDITSGGSVTVVGALANGSFFSGGRILVAGESSGAIKVGEETGSLTLIQLTGGLGEEGTIEINTSKGAFNADGDIVIGTTACSASPPDITFDGCIHIYEQAHGQDYGDLNGVITVCGCHSSTAPLDICVDGADNGNVIISQNGCPNQVDWSCPQEGCP